MLGSTLIALFLQKNWVNAHAAVCQWLCDVPFLLYDGGKHARRLYQTASLWNTTGDLYSKTNQMHSIPNLFYFGATLYMFRTVSSSIIRSLRLYI